MSVPAPARAQLDWLLRDLEADPGEVRQAIAGLNGADLRRYGYDSFYLNLLGLFGERWGERQTAAHAAQAVRAKLWHGWEYYAHLHKVGRLGERPRPRLDGEGAVMPPRGGRPILFCAHHLGDYRDLPTDLCLGGHDLLLPLDHSAFRQSSRALLNIAGLLDACLRVVDVEASGGALAVARHLLAGGSALVYADGNTGLDGPTGGSTRQEVELLGFRAAVKDGWARLAAATGATVVPIIAPRGAADHGRLVFGAPISPGGRLRRAAAEEFAASAVAAVYAQLERYAEPHSEEWETVCFVHRWRALSTSPGKQDLAVPAVATVKRALRQGARIRLDRRRFVESVHGSDRVWIDARTLRSLRWPRELDALAERLAIAPRGLDGAWLAGLDRASADRGLEVLARLVGFGTAVVDPPLRDTSFRGSGPGVRSAPKTTSP